MQKLNDTEAQQFALLLMAGVSPASAATYFLPSKVQDEALQEAAQTWCHQREVMKHVEAMSGGPWEKLTKEQRLQVALDKMYAEMAFFLWSHSYGDLQGLDRQKADTCRAALEAKLAGTAGKGNAIERFYEDLLKLGGAKGVGGVPWKQ